jgi:hypothetical protein
MKITRRQLKRIIKEEYSRILNEGTAIVPWFIEEFRGDFGAHFDRTYVNDDAYLKNFKVQFLGGKSPYASKPGYVFKKVRVIFENPEPTWEERVVYQMVYALHSQYGDRDYLPSKSTTSSENIKLSYTLRKKYTQECVMLGIEVLDASQAKKYARAPYASE